PLAGGPVVAAKGQGKGGAQQAGTNQRHPNTLFLHGGSSCDPKGDGRNLPEPWTWQVGQKAQKHPQPGPNVSAAAEEQVNSGLACQAAPVFAHAARRRATGDG